MKKLLTLFTVLGLTAYGYSQDLDYDEMLKVLDERSSFMDSDFSARATMISEDPEEGIDRNTIRMFRRDNRDEFLILFEAPETKIGQGYLRIGENLWFYDPESRKFSHTSMKDSFDSSDARNSDFSRSSYSEDYRVARAESGTLGRFDVWVLDLEGKHNEVTYPFQKIWVTKDNLLILKTEDYSLNQRLLRTSLYPGWSKVGDSYTPNKMIFIDELVEGKKTQVNLSNLSVADIRDDVFTKAYVERVSQ
jgi:outer membrane lipoprotein-sorting protein